MGDTVRGTMQDAAFPSRAVNTVSHSAPEPVEHGGHSPEEEDVV